MARARNIKPGFFTHDGLAELPPLNRLLFIGLWTVADRAGRIEDRPKRIKAEVMPYDDCDVNEMLAALEGGGFIKRYRAGDVAAIQILAWDKHQNPHIKEAESTIQAWCENSAGAVQVPDAGKPKPEPAGRIPDSGFPLTDSNGAGAFVLPEWIPKDTWAAYLKTRSGKKAKNEPHALGLILKDLEAFQAKGHDPVTVLNNSIKGGWAGVFEPKTAPGENRSATTPTNPAALFVPERVKTAEELAAGKAIATQIAEAFKSGKSTITHKGAH